MFVYKSPHKLSIFASCKSKEISPTYFRDNSSSRFMKHYFSAVSSSFLALKTNFPIFAYFI